MRQTILGGLTAVFLLVAAPALAAEPPRSGHPVFDRVVELVMDRFHDASALDRFTEAVRNEVGDSAAPVTAESPDARVDEAIDSVLASLQASHTGRYTPDGIDYFELADIFRFAIRDRIERLFPPEGRVRYPGIGMVTRSADGLRFVTDVTMTRRRRAAAFASATRSWRSTVNRITKSNRSAARRAGRSRSNCAGTPKPSR